MREACSILVLVFGLVPTIYFNILGQALQYRPCHDADRYPAPQAICGILEKSRAVGFGTIWRLYSPTWKHTIWLEFVRVDAEGVETAIPTMNLSPTYRAERSTLDSLLFDIKVAIVQSRLSSMQQLQEAYARYLCGRLGPHVARIRAYRFHVMIPPNFEGGDSFANIPPLKHQFGDWSCDAFR